MLLSSAFEGEDVLTLASDSSGSWGTGAMTEHECFALQWPVEVPRRDLTRLELYPIVLSFYIWLEHFENRRVRILCDNQGTCAILSSLRAEDFITRNLIRMLALHCMTHKIYFQACYIPTHLNTGPDALSRGQFAKFSQLFPHHRPSTSSVPHFLLPSNCLI